MMRLCLAACLAATPLCAGEALWRLDGFAQPESALYDAARDRIIVTNIAGHPGEADGVGGLSLVSPQGEMIEARWVDGMDAPKGIALLGDRLLIADLAKLRVLDAETGAEIETLSPPGAEFLNDVASDGVAAYVSDMMTGTIWRWSPDGLEALVESGPFTHPNGLFADNGALIVADWGAGMRADFSTETPGQLWRVDLQSRAAAAISAPLGNLDGVARIGDALYVTDWITGEVFAMQDAPARAFTAPSGAADISAFGDALLIPLMRDGALELRRP